MGKFLFAAPLAVVLLCPRAAHAGASLLVDDAGVTADGHCQLESWLRARSGKLQEATALPACAWDGVEYSLGASLDPSGMAGGVLLAGFKHGLLDVGEHTPGLAVALNGDWRHGLDAATAYLALSQPLGPRWMLQANLGVGRLRHAGGSLVAGVGLEYRAGARWSWLAEGYAEGRTYRALQGGLRLRLPGAVSVDLLVGRERAGRWLTLGLNWSPGDR